MLLGHGKRREWAFRVAKHLSPTFDGLLTTLTNAGCK